MNADKTPATKTNTREESLCRSKADRVNPLLFTVLCAAVMIAAIVIPFLTSAPAKEALAAGGFKLEITNFTPNDTDLMAMVRIDGDSEEYSNRQLSFSPSGSYLTAQTTTISSWAMPAVRFGNVKSGYVPAVILATKTSANSMVSDMARGKTFKQVYTEYCKRFSDSDLDSVYGPFDIEYENQTDATDGIWFSFAPDPDRNTVFKSEAVVIVAGAIPVDNNAVSLSLSAPASMTIGDKNIYSSDWTVRATITNNSSYPIFCRTGEYGYLSKNPNNSGTTLDEGTFRLMDSGGFWGAANVEGMDRSYIFIPAGKSATRTESWMSVGAFNGKFYYNLALLGTADYGRANFKVENYTYIAAGMSGGEPVLPKAQCLLERSAQTTFPAAQYDTHNLVEWNRRAMPVSATPGMLGVSQKNGEHFFDNLVPDDIMTGDYADSFELTLSGKNMDRVHRVVVVPRGHFDGQFLSFPDYLKSAVTYTNITGRWEKLNGGNNLPTPGWSYVVRPIKQQTSSKIVLSINVYDVFYPGTSLTKDAAAKTAMSAYWNSAYESKPNYLDVYMLCEDEWSKPIETTYWTFDDPRVIENHTPEFSITITSNASNSATLPNNENSKLGGNYLAIVPSTIVGGKPISAALSVTDKMDASQFNYKSLVFTGLTSSITRSTQNGTVWKMTVNGEVRVNDYLRVTANNSSGEAYITIDVFPGFININSTNCLLYADSLLLMRDFTCTLTTGGETPIYWYSNQFDKVSDKSGANVGNRYYEATDTWFSGTKLYGTDIKPSQLRKIKFLPKDPSSSAGIKFDIGVMSGGIKGVYPYTQDCGLTLNLETLGFLPDFVKQLLKIDDWDKIIEEVRYPYTGDLPQIYTGDDLEFGIGGNFLFFEIGANATFNLNTLWEEAAKISVIGNVNLFNKLVVTAELTLSEYGDKGLIPDKIFFSLGSDCIGLVPPMPFIELSNLAGGINDIGKTFAKEGWNYLPPISVTLSAGGAIGLPFGDLEIELGNMELTVGLNKLEVSLKDISLGPVTLCKEATLRYTGDFSEGVEIPGTNGFKLSMPVVELSGEGKLCLDIAGYLTNFATGNGNFSFKFNGATALRAFIRKLGETGQSTASFKATAAKLVEWQKGKKDMAVLWGLLKELGFDMVQEMQSDLIDYAAAFSLNVTLKASFVIPDVLPGIGGKSIASGQIKVEFLSPFFIAHAEGTFLGATIGFSLVWDMREAFSEGHGFSVYTLAANGEKTFYESNVEEKPVNPPDGGGGKEGIRTVAPLVEGASGRAADAGPQPLAASAADFYFDVTEGEDQILVSVDVPVKTEIALTNGSATVTISEDDESAWTKIEGGGWLASVLLTGAAPGRWYVTGEGITGVRVAVVRPIEQVGDVVFDGEAVGFDFSNPQAGESYVYEVYIVSESGVRIFAASGEVLEGANSVDLPEGFMARLQSGNYKAIVTVHEAETGAPIGSYGESGFFDYTNPDAPAAPDITGADYIGDGFYEVSDGINAELGYEARIIGPDNFGMTIDYAPGSRIVFGVGLVAGESYTVYFRAYLDMDGYKVFGPESAGFALTARAIVSAVITASPDIFVSGAYYTKLSYTSDDTETVTFLSADCVSYTVTVTDSRTGQTVTESGTGALEFAYAFDLTNASRYTVIIETVTAYGDSGRAIFIFCVDGTGPVFVVDTSSAIFDGTVLTFEGFLEEGAVITLQGGTWTYNIADKSMRDAANDYSGVWTGTLAEGAAVLKEIQTAPYGADQSEMETYATIYEIFITARDLAGNESQVLLITTLVSDSAENLRQVALDTTAGNTLSLGMEGILLLAGAVYAPLFNERSVNISDLTDLASSDPSVVTVDEEGRITIIGVGSAIISGAYNGMEAALYISVVDSLPLGVSIIGTTDDSITLLVPALPGLSGTLIVSAGGREFDITEGIDREQTLLIDGLTEDTVISFILSGSAYETVSVYFTVPTALPDGSCSCDKCPICGGCLEDVCCEEGDCECGEKCPGHDGGNDNGNDGLPGGAIAAIVIGSVLVAAIGGFAIYWFVIKKKTFANLLGK